MRVCTLSDFIWFRYIMKTMNEDLKSVSFRETVITTPWSEETSIELKLKREASEQERDERALRWYKFLEMGDSTKPPLFWLPVGPSKGSGRGSHFPQDSTVIWLVLCISECSKRNLEVILFRCDFFYSGGCDQSDRFLWAHGRKSVPFVYCLSFSIYLHSVR